MIHFDFTVDEVDAENIIDCIHSEICRIRESAISEPKLVIREHLVKHADYLESLKGLMTNRRVKKRESGCQERLSQ